MDKTKEFLHLVSSANVIYSSRANEQNKRALILSPAIAGRAKELLCSVGVVLEDVSLDEFMDQLNRAAQRVMETGDLESYWPVVESWRAA